MPHTIRFFSILYFFIWVQSPLHAQEIKVSGRFLKDSVQIGESVGYSLAAKYPKELSILFPDSLYGFTPFEYTSKKFFQTRTTDGISYDSAVYYLTTFEIDKIQKLRLPIFVAAARDCVTFNAVPDSISLIELVNDPIPDSLSAQNLPLKTATLYEKVFSQLNYFIITIVIVIILLFLLITWVLFGKRIIRHFRTKRLLKSHQEFISRFTTNINQLTNGFSRELAEQTLSIWKKYMEQLERKPYTKLTTRETMSMVKDGNLGNNLRVLDSAIYGNQTSVIDPLKNLQLVAENHFNKKLESLRNG